MKDTPELTWTENIAYAIGLITSDGYLAARHCIRLGSKDLEQIENFKIALSLKNRIGKNARGGETEKKYFYVAFKNKSFYNFLLKIGLTPAKSRTIREVLVPNNVFPDFLRGLFDGDGTFYTFQDKRWPNSFGFKLSFASASPDFILWLKNRLSDLYNVKGYLHKGAGVINLEYTKSDTRILNNIMYYNHELLSLTRKYLKVKTALDKDRDSGILSLQKHHSIPI